MAAQARIAGNWGRKSSMPESVLLFLIVFYAGAVLASWRCWYGVWRGAIGFSALRDVTGIGDRAALRRLFGLTRPDGSYRVTLAAVLQHRRRAGIMLTDIPVHLLFLAALGWAALHGGTLASAAISCAAAAHGLALAAAAISVLVRARQPLLG
jgi:hypothetical protein